jgi:hypothetical protein
MTGTAGEQMVIPQAAVPLEALLEPDVHAEQQLAEPDQILVHVANDDSVRRHPFSGQDAAQTALGRFVEESDVADAVRFLVSLPPARSPVTTFPSTPAGTCDPGVAA